MEDIQGFFFLEIDGKYNKWDTTVKANLKKKKKEYLGYTAFAAVSSALLPDA